ncbi:16S rRNA (guanine(966)-N(2))-methyltransferase RsmD [Paenibacillus sp. J5C_2022]|uniref:16S rRNA (guanine(966)-N(2))-methyltransferase RsmD n=1 Tax=Paenibacillus sp. J5C2022 TaxID=2977129 RepID=UPI0021D10698|nr:16S rRNA (guanine(966)-N(2))-methyltransferase RsmD [Paenibacillus sp. J5C2022]MCU6712302.1 16S rRNA (guanine(966)-N(2))-methyltransferase RsmD [Paenibacillus sp. J5C2022]
MRVVAGQARGRVLKAVPGMNTRPTMDKVKEAIFSMIGPYFDGGVALDLFAGTGGLGIEAWSRGIARIIFVDREKLSIDTIRHNVKAAGAEQAAEIYRNDAERALKALAKRGLSFRLVFLDPPYRMTNMDAMISGMAEAGMLELDAIVVIEHDTAVVYPDEIAEFQCLKKAKYGDTSVTVYRYIANDSMDSKVRREDDDNA